MFNLSELFFPNLYKNITILVVGSAVLTISMILFGVGISVWWISVMIRCYLYMRDLNIQRSDHLTSLPLKAQRFEH